MFLFLFLCKLNCIRVLYFFLINIFLYWVFSPLRLYSVHVESFLCFFFPFSYWNLQLLGIWLIYSLNIYFPMRSQCITIPINSHIRPICFPLNSLLIKRKRKRIEDKWLVCMQNRLRDGVWPVKVWNYFDLWPFTRPPIQSHVTSLTSRTKVTR